MLFAGRTIGLEIHQGGCSFVIASGKRLSPVIEKYSAVDFPSEVLRLSIKETNIVDAQVLQASVSAAYQHLGTDLKRLSLSIPDASGRIMMLDMESLPRKREEAVDQIKWKLKKNFPVDLNDMHLDYQVISTDQQGSAKVIAAVISKSVVTGFEDICLSSGLEPTHIDFASFNLHRLFSDRLEVQEDLALVILFRGNLTVMVFSDGLLDFHRSKQIAVNAGDPVKLFREVNSSLLVYSDSRGGVRPQRIFYFSAPPERALLRSVIFEATSIEPLLIDTDNLISSSRQQVDRVTLSELLSALGAAARGLS